MAYVERSNGVIVGVYANPQPGYAEEKVADDSPEVAAFFSPPAPVPTAVSFAQMLIGLVAEQWITKAEGEGWLTGALPEAVIAVINKLPQEQQFAAKARALRPSEVSRADPLVAAMGAAAGKTEVEMDDFFRKYAQI